VQNTSNVPTGTLRMSSNQPTADEPRNVPVGTLERFGTVGPYRVRVVMFRSEHWARSSVPVGTICSNVPTGTFVLMFRLEQLCSNVPVGTFGGMEATPASTFRGIPVCFPLTHIYHGYLLLYSIKC
jgi:hypothetical protein